MVKRMTFNHSHKGSSPLDLIKEKKDVVRYRTDSFSHFYEIIIPFYMNKLQTSNNKNYLDFCEVSKIIKSKSHLTEEYLEKIKLIKSRMNSKRI